MSANKQKNCREKEGREGGREGEWPLVRLSERDTQRGKSIRIRLLGVAIAQAYNNVLYMIPFFF